MLGFLFGFLGLGAAAAAAGGGGSGSTPAKQPEVVFVPPAEDTNDDHMGPGDDMVETGGDDHMGHGDDTVETGDDDHMGHGDDTVETGGDDHMGHGDDTVETGGDDHMGHGDDTVETGGDDHMGHGDMDFEQIALPENEAEIAAFVAAVQASPEMHVHDATSSKMGEHMAAMDLVPRDEATHIAIGHGDWDDPSNWHNGLVPGDDARVLIPDGVHMTYDHVSDARLFTLRVDGKLEFATDVDSQMVVDTIVITPTGALQIGTEGNPVDPNVNVDIIFANNGAIDTDWDPMLLSRGMIAHGSVDIHGTVKDSHEKVIDDPMAGDTWVEMGEVPEGWAVGDTIVIAGTRYNGWHDMPEGQDYPESQDETRVITQIDDGMVFFDDPLEHDHDTPREDLKTSVANYTRNVSFETEDADLAEVYERGHVMFMHNDDVDVRYAEFHELGRTDKSETALNVDEFASIDFDTNVKGRYAFHFHRAGLEDQEDPGISIGNAVFGSPGWGFVHHDSNALFENNATYDTFGAGYVAESGNETGAWNDNIAIFSVGRSWSDPKSGNDPHNFDMGASGDGFWFQGRMVESTDNVAASVNTGFTYFHRGPVLTENGMLQISPDASDFPGLFHYNDGAFVDMHPIVAFDGNEAFAAQQGLFVLKASPFQNHDVHSVLSDFTGWEVRIGASMAYTGHYTLKDFDLVGREATDEYGRGAIGIIFGANTFDMTVIDATIDSFGKGILLGKDSTFGLSAEANDFTLINPTFTDVDTEYLEFNPGVDDIITEDDYQMLTPDIALDGPLTYSAGGSIIISGTKTDTLGEINFPTDAETFDVNWGEKMGILEEKGYYSTSDGQNYFMMDIFFSDRITGSIYMEEHPVLLDDNVPVGQDTGSYRDIVFNGIQDLGGEDDPTIDSALLWATLTEGQVVLSDEALAILDNHEEEELADAI